ANKMARKVSQSYGVGFLQDVEIWKHKTRIENPLLCPEDGPVYQLRRWYEQFYVDVEDVTEDMTARYEYEVDTTRAVATWEAEVRCAVLAAAGIATGRPTALVDGCPALRDSIERAVADGRLAVRAGGWP